jgi:signal transduction histidine kinase
MPMNTTTTTSGINDGDKLETTATLNAKTGEVTQKAASLNGDSKESLLRAQQNALEAKEAALGAINRFYRESRASETKATRMLTELEDALQFALDATRKSRGSKNKNSQEASESTTAPHDEKNLKEPSKILHANPFGIVTDLKRSLFKVKPTDAEVKEEFYKLVMRKSPQLRQLIDDLTEDKAQVRIEKVISEAKSEIAAARVAVSKAQQEVNTTKEEAKKTYIDAENARKAAELLVSQVKQETITKAADEIIRAREEVKAAKGAASMAVQRAEEEIRKNCEEAATVDRNAQVTVALANEKLKKYAEELKAYKLQAHIAVKQAREEATKAKAEAEAARSEIKEALEKSALESAQAKADIETAQKMMREATVIAEKHAYDEFLEEVNDLRQEISSINAKAREAINKAQRESHEAKEELAMVRKTSEEAVSTARREASEAREEAERAKQSMVETKNRSREETHKLRQQTETSIIQASEAITQAKKDIIDITRDDIIRSRQELEAPFMAAKSDDKQGAEKLDAGYVATVLHEMRSPLHSISGFTKLLKEDDVADEATRQEFLSIMEQQSETLNKLIDDLSDILNNKNEGLTINVEEVSSYDMINEAINGAQSTAQQRNNLIGHNLTPELPEVKADASRIKQVLTNLLTNAIKFSPENRPIFVKAQPKDNELLVQVVDYGIGIPKGELKSIFNKGHRAGNHSDVEGSGLGLYVCQQIIKAHSGNIWAESVEGEGSTFCFTLPIVVTEQPKNKLVEKSYVG